MAPIICSCQLPRQIDDPLFGLYFMPDSLPEQYRSKKNIRLPIENIDYDVKISNITSETTIVQTYKNYSDSFISAQYIFPISSDACFHSFEAEFNGKIIKGTVKEKQQAKQEFNENKKKGNTVALQQISEDSPDIMKIDIANIQPNATIKIKIKCIEELKISISKLYTYKILQKMTPRYCNSSNQTDASEFNIQSNSQHKPLKQNIQIQVNCTSPIDFLQTPNYVTQLMQYNDARTQVNIKFENIQNFQFDFQLLFTSQQIQKPQVLVSKNPNNDQIYAQLTFVPNFSNLNANDAFQQYLTDSKNFQVDMQSSPAEFIFILDRSGSMSGGRIKQAVKSLQIFMQSLPENSYFNIYSYGSNFTKMYNQSVIYNQQNLQHAQNQISGYGADYGCTEMYPPIQDALNQYKRPNLPRLVFLLTDGDITQPKEVIQLVKKNLKSTRMHTIGIGSGCSEYLVKQVAEAGKGYSIFIQDNEQMSEKIINLLEKSLTPCLDGFQVDFDKNIIESITPNPQNMPLILKNEPCTFYVTLKKGFENQQQTRQAEIKLRYYDSTIQGHLDYSLMIDNNCKVDENLYKLAIFKQIQVLENSQDRPDLNKSQNQYQNYLQKAYQCKQGHNLDYMGLDHVKIGYMVCDECNVYCVQSNCGSYRCPVCDYDRCEKCQNNNFMYCQKGHNLQYFSPIHQRLPNLICDLCNQFPSKMYNCGSYRCESCDFDICDTCFKNLILNDKQEKQIQETVYDDIYFAKQVSIKDEIENLSIKNQILCSKTAFICVIDQINDSQSQQFNSQIQEGEIQKAQPKQYNSQNGFGSFGGNFYNQCNSSNQNLFGGAPQSSYNQNNFAARKQSMMPATDCDLLDMCDSYQSPKMQNQSNFDCFGDLQQQQCNSIGSRNSIQSNNNNMGCNFNNSKSQSSINNNSNNNMNNSFNLMDMAQEQCNNVDDLFSMQEQQFTYKPQIRNQQQQQQQNQQPQQQQKQQQSGGLFGQSQEQQQKKSSGFSGLFGGFFGGGSKQQEGCQQPQSLQFSYNEKCSISNNNYNQNIMQSQQSQMKKKKNNNKQAGGGDVLYQCLQLQQFNGQWQHSQQLLGILGISQSQIQQYGNQIKDLNVLITVMVLVWLQKKQSGSKSVWQLCARKAEKYLDQQLDKNNRVQIQQQIEQSIF